MPVAGEPAMNDELRRAAQAELERVADPHAAPLEAQLGRTLRDYWLDRAAQHTKDTYVGVPMSKFPEDLRVYEHLLWVDKPNVVIELGSHLGASALWFRDRLRTLAAYGLIDDYRVITVDVDIDHARHHLERVDRDWEEQICLVAGDVCDEHLPERVAELLPEAARCLVVEDSAHVYATTMAALRGFARFVSPGGFMVVEDGCVDIEPMRLNADWPRGVLPAVADWLAGPLGRDFVPRRDLELYGVTCHPGGLLQRRRVG
jgi:cephalosporin hydroxylase